MPSWLTSYFHNTISDDAAAVKAMKAPAQQSSDSEAGETEVGEWSIVCTIWYYGQITCCFNLGFLFTTL